MEQSGDVTKLDVGGLAKLAEVGQRAIHFLRIRQSLACDGVRACKDDRSSRASVMLS